jgi:hypothetical protein
MTDAMWVIGICSVSLGVYLTYLINKVKDLEEQVDSYYEVVVAMAKELKSLGSNNVEIREVSDDE